MKTTILLLTFLFLCFNSSAYANRVKCKFYDVVCKAKKFTADTKAYQEREFKKASQKVKGK
jgi:hypothetical protein